MVKFGIDVIVFDGYAVSAKDCTHEKPTEESNIVDIRDDNSCQAERELFFAKYSKKEKFILKLDRKLESNC